MEARMIAFARKALALGVKVEVLQLAFFVGAVAGMVAQTVLMTVPRLAFTIIGALM
jgi:hypothetical protein